MEVPTPDFKGWVIKSENIAEIPQENIIELCYPKMSGLRQIACEI